MNISFRCLESRIDTNDTLYGKFSITSVPSGQGNTFANALRRSLFSDLSGLAITHFCITSNPKLDYEFATLPGLTESLLDFSLNLKKIVLTGRLVDNFSETVSYSEKPIIKPSHEKLLGGAYLPAVTAFCLQSTALSPKVTPSLLAFVRSKEDATLGDKHSTYPSVAGDFLQTRNNTFGQSAQVLPAYFVKSLLRKDSKKKEGHRIHPLGDSFRTSNVVARLSSRSSHVRSKNFVQGEKFLLRKEAQHEKQKEAKNNRTLEKSLSSTVALASIGFLKVKGPATLRASDLILPPGVRCVHPNQYLGTLAADGALSIKFVIATGKGYVIQDETFYDSLSRANLLPKLNSQNDKFLTLPSLLGTAKLTPENSTSYSKGLSSVTAKMSPFHSKSISNWTQLARCIWTEENTLPSCLLSSLGLTGTYCVRSNLSDEATPSLTKVKPAYIVKSKDKPFICTNLALSIKQKESTPNVYCNLEKKPFLIKTNLSKKLTNKQFVWDSEQNFYPVLPLDATFTPISKVNFQIDVNRDKEKNQETIIFEVWTNGSITPKRAIQESSLNLAQDFYNLFCSLNESSNFELWWKRESVGLKNTSIASFNKEKPVF